MHLLALALPLHRRYLTPAPKARAINMRSEAFFITACVTRNILADTPMTPMTYGAAHYKLPVHMTDDTWTRKEIGVVIRMTTEFLKDMDMKMRDVRRVERYYYGTQDFGAGRIFSQIENKFEHMIMLYKNASYIMRIMGKEIDLRSDVVGSLQFMLGDYMEMLGLIEMFKERYSLWRANADRSRIRDIIKRFLLRHGEQPTGYEREEDQWRRVASRRMRTSAHAREDASDEDEDENDEYIYKYVGFDAWYESLFDNDN